jgi:hypothetical protein
LRGQTGENFGLGSFLDQPRATIFKGPLPQYQPGFLNVLPLYIVLLGFFPMVLLLLRHRPSLPLRLSAAVYLLRRRFGWQPHGYPDGGGCYFNPFAWQFLFIGGATTGYFQMSSKPGPRGPLDLQGRAFLRDHRLP